MAKATYHPTSKAPLATEVDHARMAAILAKHSRRKVEVHVPEVVESPKEKLPALEWEAPRKATDRGYYSVCRRYSVCSITIAGHDIFEAWKLAGGGAWYYQLAHGLKSFEQAEAVAQADADKVSP